jgi:hypothetical protein
VAIASKNWDAGARALLIQAAMKSELPATRAKIITAALQMAREKGKFRLMALGLAPMVIALTPSSELLWFSGDAARILIAANDVGGARRWLSFAKTQDLKDDKKAGLWPLYVLLSEDPIALATPEAILTWWKARGGVSEDKGTRIRTFFSLINSMGVTIPSELWTVSDDANPVKNYGPRASVRNALSQAAAVGSRGGAVVLSLIALGSRGPVPENLPAVEMSIAALKRLGFDKEAQAIALETAIESGL